MLKHKRALPIAAIMALLGALGLMLLLLIYNHTGGHRRPVELAVIAATVLLLSVPVILVERRRNKEKLEKANGLYEQLLSNIDGGVVTSVVLPDGSLELAYASSGWVAITGYTAEEVRTLFRGNPTALMLAEDREGCMQSYVEQCKVGNGYQMQYRVNCKNGDIRWVIDRGVVLKDENGRDVNQSILTDITSIKEHEERLRLQAQSDPLTGLYNKISSQSVIDEVISDSVSGQCHALFMLDIDNFKGVNDTLGHLFGDSVLIEMASRLRRMFRGLDVLGRIGGDEFVVFMTNLPSREMGISKAERLCQEFCRSYAGEKGAYIITCSVGVAFFQQGDKFETMYQRADTALYQAKLDGRNRSRVFDGNELAGLQQHRALLTRTEENNSSSLQVRERIFELLYGSVDFSGSVNMVLALLGGLYDVSRVYVFETSQDRKYLVNTYEWCSDETDAMIDTLQTVENHIGAGDDADYFAQFGADGIFYCGDAQQEISSSFRETVRRQGIHSMLQVTIAENDTPRGFVGFDECKGQRPWTLEERGALVYAAKLLGTFILKKRATDQMLLANHDRVAALDNLPNSIYVTDDQCTVTYMNNMTRSQRPLAQLGEKCYKAFMENDAPCKGCPAQICADGSLTVNIYNPTYHSWYLTTAAPIAWGGKEGMRLVCCQDIGEFMRATEGTDAPPAP